MSSWMNIVSCYHQSIIRKMASGYAGVLCFLIVLHCSCTLTFKPEPSQSTSKSYQCQECNISFAVLESVLQGVVARMDKHLSESEKLKEKVNHVAFQLDRQSSVVETLKRLEEKFDKMGKTLLSCIGEERTLSSELQAHDKRLMEHENGNQKQKQQIDVIHYVVVAPRDCNDVALSGETKSAVYRVVPGGKIRQHEIPVYCDFITPGGGWLVFQRREDGSVNFERNWNEYAKGFGNPIGEFWLGNDNLYYLTSTRKYKLRIDMEDFAGERRYAEYSTFSITSKDYLYRLTVSGYSGNAGDSFSVHNGMMFSTIDSDNDVSDGHCAQKYHGAWWYESCHASNLNGLYLGGPHESHADGIEWRAWHGYNYSLKTTEMKLAAVS